MRAKHLQASNFTLPAAGGVAGEKIKQLRTLYYVVGTLQLYYTSTKVVQTPALVAPCSKPLRAWLPPAMRSLAREDQDAPLAAPSAP